MPFTPNERFGESDPVLRVRHHITSAISLADDAEYSLGPRIPTGFAATNPRLQVPLKGRYRVSNATALDEEYNRAMEFSVRPQADIVPTAWQVTANVATLTVPAGHGLRAGQWIRVSGFPTAPAAVGNSVTPAVVLITDLNDNAGAASGVSVRYSATTANASATENGNIRAQKVSLIPGEKVVVFDSLVTDELPAMDIGALRRGKYSVSTPEATSTNGTATYHSDGTLLVISTYVGAGVIPIGFDDADVAAMTNITTSGGRLLLNANNGTGRVRVEFEPDEFIALDVDGYACLFEKNGDLILRNRLGSTQTFEIERL